MITQRLQNTDLSQINLLTIQEVAEWGKVSTKSFYRWISDNKIPAIRLGNRTYRIPEKAIIANLKQFEILILYLQCSVMPEVCSRQ
jgi:excisionase family DNA binding protein